MQRNSHFLKKHNMRPGMAMIMAIAFVIIIATIMMVMMSMTAQTTKRTENLYFTEQAQLLAKSATEYALLAISGHNRTGESCVQTITSQYPAVAPIFNINTTIRYIGLNPVTAGSTCDQNSFVDTINTVQSQGTVLIDVVVTSNNANLGIDQDIRYHRRTVQKP